ncbi:MAG: hypothetical protein ACRD1H_08435 [Vicinamibacterales bacterium]
MGALGDERFGFDGFDGIDGIDPEADLEFIHVDDGHEVAPDAQDVADGQLDLLFLLVH